jgi:O-antigen/teichoic acid export membrane protein
MSTTEEIPAGTRRAGKHRRRSAVTAELDTHLGSGLSWSFANNVLSRLGSVLSGVVLARLLVPADYGVFAAAMVVLGAILSMNELGVSLAVVRWPGPPDRIAPTVLTMSTVASVAMYAACFAAAPYVADALSAPHATLLIRVLCVCVLADGVTAVSAALITRAFDQRKRAVIDLASFVVGTGVAVTLAVLGAGAWSMVWGYVVSNVLASGLTVLFAPQRVRFGWDPDAARTLMAFGAPLAGSSLLMFVMLNVDYVVVGHLLGAVDLGIYLLAFNLSAWPANLVSASVRRVSLAGFARLLEQPAARVGETFARAAGLLLAVALPMAVMLAVYAHPLVLVLYGQKWAAAVDVLQLLCVLGVVRVLTELAYDFLVALGRTTPNLWLQLLWVGCLVPGLVVGAHLGGIVGVAAAHAVIALGVIVPAYLLELRRCGVGPVRLAAVAARPVGGGILIVASGLGALQLISGHLAELAVGGIAGLVLYLAAVGSMRAMLRTGDLVLARAAPDPS